MSAFEPLDDTENLFRHFERKWRRKVGVWWSFGCCCRKERLSGAGYEDSHWLRTCPSWQCNNTPESHTNPAWLSYPRPALQIQHPRSTRSLNFTTQSNRTLLDVHSEHRFPPYSSRRQLLHRRCSNVVVLLTLQCPTCNPSRYKSLTKPFTIAKKFIPCL